MTSKSQHEFFQDPRVKKIKKYFLFSSTHHYAEDFGHMISETPLAIFLPPTVEVLQQFLPLACEYKIKISCRGKGNSVYGQSQVENGVIIDLKDLNLSFEFNSDGTSSIRAPAFRTWSELIEYSKHQNKTVPVTVDSLDLTIGGTLSFAALGGTSYRCGSGADNVLGLDIVTLDGERHICSKTENRELFDAALCGLGQFGIIINVIIPLITAKKKVTMHLLSYDHADQFLREQKALYNSKLFDHLKGYARKRKDQWAYVIEAVSYYDESEDKCVKDQLMQLSPKDHAIETMSYWEFINTVTEVINELRVNGKLNVPHPWYTVLMPEKEVEEHLTKLLAIPWLMGTEPIVIYPMNSACFQQALFIKPEAQTFYLLAVLYNTSMDATHNLPYQEILNRNKILYLEAKKVGGCRYPIDAIPFSPEDWSQHFGKKWKDVCALKEKYDPKHLLSTGINIFD